MLNPKLFAATLTFALGVTAVGLWFFLGQISTQFLEIPASVAAEVEPVITPKPAKSLDKSYLKGRTDAARDADAGKLAVWSVGLMSVYDYTLRDLLLKNYNVQLMGKGCVISEEDEQWVEGYNEAAQAEIDRRFGRGATERTRVQAEQKVQQMILEFENKAR